MKIIYQKALAGGLCLCWFVGAALGQTNQVLYLNGTSAYVSIPSSSTLQPPNAITVEAWVYPTATNANGCLIDKSDGQNGVSQRTYELKWVPTGLDFAVYFSLPVPTGQPDYAEIITPVSEDVWTHIAATYSTNAGLAIYTNGSLATVTNTYNEESFIGLTLRQTTEALCFGVCPTVQALGEGDTFASGYMDEVRIWDTNRSGAEIAEDRFCVLTGTESNLMGYWNFDNGTADDLTTNGNNGTLEGGAIIVPINGPDVVHDGVCGAPYIDPASLSYSALTGFRQKILGPRGMTIAVETSTNLADWSTLFILPNFTGEFEFDDVDDVSLPQCFYKIVAQ
jgi:hypothetical protein